MFGQNPIRKQQRYTDGQSLFVEEIFNTIQGEGPYAGCPATFIRLSGCNLRCTFCDTQFEYGMQKMPFSIDKIVRDALDTYDAKIPKLVVLTGGEPLRQNIVPLICKLLEAGVGHIQIETAGTLWLDRLTELIISKENPYVDLVCSPKTPHVHGMVSRLCHHWKYIVQTNGVDLDTGIPNINTQDPTKKRNQVFFPVPYSVDTIWIQPCDEYDDDKNKLNTQTAVEIVRKYGYRLCLQLHKQVGLP